jgi:multiple antibiotic resistance protein
VAIAVSLLLHYLIAIITILNPFAAASVMVSLIGENATSKEVRDIAFKTTATVAIASLVTFYLGEYIFNFFGINVMSIKVMGGILLIIVALNMASGKMAHTRHTDEEHAEALESEDIATVPLGIPILFGPGTIATLIVLSSPEIKIISLLENYLLVSLAILIDSIIVYIILRNAIYVNKMLGVTGMKIFTRIMGLIVGAIAVQFLVFGVKGLWNG